MILPAKTLERNLFKRGYSRVIGVDEVGMGCLAGPVVVCAVEFRPGFYRRNYKDLSWLRESKSLSPGQRNKFVKSLLKKHIRYQICWSFPKTIDRLNIYQSARRAMKRAIEKLGSKKVIVLVDGPHRIIGIELDQQAIIKGDRKVFAIACASIIAKVYRDKMMIRYGKRYPGYGFEKHKGYGTKYHQAQLVTLGPCEIHRRSFAPVAKLATM